MLKGRVFIASNVAAVLCALILCSQLVDGRYLIGYGNRDVSPTEEQMRRGECFLGGYGVGPFRGRPTGVHDPITARTFLVEDPTTRTTVVHTILDTVGVTNKVLNRIRSAVLNQTGIPVENVFVGATHTHSGPDLQGLWGGVSAAYEQDVVDGTVLSIVQAWRSRRDGNLFASKIAVDQIYANNRRGWGYTDTEMTVLDAVGLDGRRIATFVNFQAHPVVLGSSNLLCSADYIYYTRLGVEEALGAPAIYFNGPIGDVSPGSRSGSEFEAAENYGRTIASFAVNAIRAGSIKVDGALGIRTAFYRHKVNNPLFLLAFKFGLADYEVNPDDTIDTRCSYFFFGKQVQGVAFPGESLTRNAEPIKAAMVADFKIFLGLSGDTLGYFVPTDEWRIGLHDNYEENVSIDKFVGDTTRDILINLIVG